MENDRLRGFSRFHNHLWQDGSSRFARNYASGPRKKTWKGMAKGSRLAVCLWPVAGHERLHFSMSTSVTHFFTPHNILLRSAANPEFARNSDRPWLYSNGSRFYFRTHCFRSEFSRNIVKRRPNLAEHFFQDASEWTVSDFKERIVSFENIEFATNNCKKSELK